MTGKPASSGKIAALAGARAFPPLMVVMFHFSEGHHYSGIRPLDFLATRGYLWVEFFFVLSGFILAHAYWTRLKDLLQRSGYVALAGHEVGTRQLRISVAIQATVLFSFDRRLHAIEYLTALVKAALREARR